MEVEESDQEFNRKLEELKRDMDAITFEPKSEDELRRMLHASALNPLVRICNTTNPDQHGCVRSSVPPRPGPVLTPTRGEK